MGGEPTQERVARPTQAGVDPVLIQRYRQVLERQLRVERLLVFGSRARGGHRPHSDYDVILVSRDFEGISPLWRGHGLNVLWNDLASGVDIDLLCLTPEEFVSATSRSTSWLRQAAGEAVEVGHPATA